MAAPITVEGDFQSGTPVKIFESHVRVANSSNWQYDMTPDGQRFPCLEPVEKSPYAGATVTLVQNWPALLRR